MTTSLAIGLDLGGTSIKAALVDPDGRIVAAAQRPTGAERGPEPVLADMAALVDRVIEEAGVERTAVAAVGVASPGPLSRREGVVIRAGNLPGWVRVPIRDVIAERTGLPAILDNDANLAAYGEFRAGPGGVADMVLYTVGTGIGSGVILGGRLLHGAFENAGELGHTIVVCDGRPCKCGQRGCLEQYASATHLVRRTVELINDGEPSVLMERIDAGETPSGEDVANAAKAGDQAAAIAWDEVCRYLAVGVVNAQHAFNPRRVVLGGGLSLAGAFLLGRVRAAYEELRWRLADDSPEITLARLGPSAGVIGAALAALDDAMGADG